MKLDNPMKYIVIEERTPAHEAIKGRQPNRCLIIFDARLSPTLVCAGITQREHEVLSDGSIVEEGDYIEPIVDNELQSSRIRDALGLLEGASIHEALDRIAQLRQDSESLARVNEVLKATEKKVAGLSTPIGAKQSTEWLEGFAVGLAGPWGESENPYVEGYSEPLTEAYQWRAGAVAGAAQRKQNAHIR